MTKAIRIGSKWVKKGKTKRTLVMIANVLRNNIYGRGNTVYFHSDVAGVRHTQSQKRFLEEYEKYREK